jgi:hypothetical protein
MGSAFFFDRYRYAARVATFQTLSPSISSYLSVTTSFRRDL